MSDNLDKYRDQCISGVCESAPSLLADGSNEHVGWEGYECPECLRYWTIETRKDGTIHIDSEYFDDLDYTTSDLTLHDEEDHVLENDIGFPPRRTSPDDEVIRNDPS